MLTMPPVVSVIIVTFNANKTLQSAIESITEQRYPHKEIIVIDGGSRDGTVETISAFNNKISYRISEPDRGIYDAMNKGIKAATGEWLFFLGSDDRLSPGILESIFGTDTYSGIDFLYGKINLDGTTRTAGKETNFEEMIEYNIPHQAIFYNKSIFRKFGGYDLTYKILADYDLNLKIFETPEFNKKFLDKEFSIFNSRGVSNRTIDVAFFSNRLTYFINEVGLLKTDKRLGKYYFFVGVAEVLRKKYFKGAVNMMHPVLYGGRRFYYFMVGCNVLLTFIGIGRKFKYVEVPTSEELHDMN